jgi:hypothetical protein
MGQGAPTQSPYAGLGLRKLLTNCILTGRQPWDIESCYRLPLTGCNQESPAIHDHYHPGLDGDT